MTIANRGTVFKLSLLDKLTDSQGNLITDYTPEVRSTVDIADSTWNVVHSGMRKVISDGSAKKIFSDLEVDIETLCRLMITISDNTATNALLRLVGFERLRRDMEAMGLSATRFERCYFDDEAQARGLSNYVCPGEIGMLLEQIYRAYQISAGTKYHK